MKDKFKSTNDKRLENNPPQRAAVPDDPMRLQYRELSEDEKFAMGEIKIISEALWRAFDKLGASRELSLAKTHAEEACMWGVKHITRPDPTDGAE